MSGTSVPTAPRGAELTRHPRYARLMLFPRIAVGLTLLAFVVGCSSTEDAPPDAATPSESNSADGAETGGSEPVNFRPMVARRAADAGPNVDASKKLRKSFADTDCTETPSSSKPDSSIVACDADDQKYLLGPAVVSGGITNAKAVETGDDWLVAIVIDESSQKELGAWKDAREGVPALAFEHGGLVLDARVIDPLVDKGSTTIRGPFTQSEAEDLATQLREN